VDFPFYLLNVQFKPDSVSLLADILKSINLSKCMGNVCAGEGGWGGFPLLSQIDIITTCKMFTFRTYIENVTNSTTYCHIKSKAFIFLVLRTSRETVSPV